MIRVALLSTSLAPVTGWGTVTAALVHGLAEQPDVKYQVLLPRHVSREAAADTEMSVRAALTPWVGWFGSQPQRALRALLPRILLGDIDLVHAVVEFPYAITAWRLARRAGVPFIVSVHGTYAVTPFSRRLDRFLYARALRAASVITAPSRFTADAVLRELGNADLRVIANPVDYQRFQAPHDDEATRRRLGLDPGAPLILGVGALKERKGFDWLIAAFAEVARTEPQAVLAIVGSGGDGPLLERLASTAGVADRVRFLGATADDELTLLYHACDVFALLSRETPDFFEGFGTVYLEAGACGKPVVGARSGGVPSAVHHGETGFLVSPGETQEAAAAIRALLRDKNLARRLGEGGRRWAQANDSPRYAGRVAELYREVLRRGGDGVRGAAPYRVLEHRGDRS
jgi:glycosyltransferase involved in cell wall biosynthesis